MPNTTAYGNRSKLGSLIVGGFGALAGIPGLGLITNKLAEFGPFNNKQFFPIKKKYKRVIDDAHNKLRKRQ